jgi:hypothetical protein
MAHPPFTRDSIVAAVPDHLTCDLSGEAAILHLSDGIYYGLNDTGAFLWQRLQQPIRVGDLHDALLAEFDVSAEETERDILQLLNTLAEAKLIEAHNASTA